MKPTLISIITRCSLLLALGAIMSVAKAQPSGLPRGAFKEQAFVQSRALFRVGDIEHAQAMLVAGNRHGSGTFQWHVESGYGLMRVAIWCREKGDGHAAIAVAERALQQFAQATQKAGSRHSGELANLYELVGRLYEDLLGHRDAAEAAYERAVDLAPGFGQAPSLLAQLRAGKAEEQRKQ
jgi:tetratricopeptide (TPR) repeat protein